MGRKYTDEAFRCLYEKYAKLVYRTAYQYLMNPYSAEDITQEAFLKLYTKSPSFQNEEHERAWLIRVTVNLCKNSKKAKDNCHLPLNDEIEISSNSFEGKSDSRLDIETELKQLSPVQRTAVYLYYYEGFSVKETARLLRMKENTLKSHLKRAREKMKQNLKG